MTKHCSYYLLIIIFFLASCRCDQRYDCPGLSNESDQFLNYSQSDTLKFTNAAGQKLIFSFSYKNKSLPYNAQGCHGKGIGCTCDYRCESSGSVLFVSDSLSISYYAYEEGIGLNNFDRTLLRWVYNISNFSKEVRLQDSTYLNPGDSLISSLTLGGHLYSNVYIQAIDTLSPYNQNKKIWKAYFTMQDGVIGFFDKRFPGPFYRQ